MGVRIRRHAHGGRLPALAALLACLALAPPAAAGAAEPQPAPATPAEQAAAVAAGIVTAWTAKGAQLPDGRFRDYIIDNRWINAGPRDHYGPAMLGAALVIDGVRNGNSRVVLAGLKAVRWAARHPWPAKGGGDARGIVFEDMALAVAYDQTWRELAGHPAYDPYVAAWVARLKTIRFHLFPRPGSTVDPSSCTVGAERPYYNWFLVEGLATAALWELSLPNGRALSSTKQGTILERPASYIDMVDCFLNTRFGGDDTNFQVSSYGALNLGLLSDAPENPPAYDILSLALFSKIVAIVADKIQAGRTQLAELGLGAWALMAPDGDVSWFGRSQEQSWTLGMAAAGLFTISRTQGIERPDAGRMRSAAARALLRLQQRSYWPAPHGVWITPTLRQGVTRTATNEAMDPYASAAGYTGLTLLGLEWTARDPAAQDPTAAEGVAADAPNGGFRLGLRNGSFIMRRTGAVWFSVKSSPALVKEYTTDLRYESGLTAVDVLGAGGWQRVMPARPNTSDTGNRHAGYDPVGPVLRTAAGARRSVGGTAEKQDDVGGVVLDASYAYFGKPAFGPSRAVVYQPVPCGVQIVVPARAGERWEYSAFFAGKPSAVAGGGLADGEQQVSAWGPDGAAGRVVLRGGDNVPYASGERQDLYRRRLDVVPSKDGAVTFQVCRRG